MVDSVSEKSEESMVSSKPGSRRVGKRSECAGCLWLVLYNIVSQRHLYLPVCTNKVRLCVFWVRTSVIKLHKEPVEPEAPEAPLCSMRVRDFFR